MEEASSGGEGAAHDALYKRRVALALRQLQKSAGASSQRDFLKRINANLGASFNEHQLSRWMNPKRVKDQPRAVVLLAAYEVAGVKLEPPSDEDRISGLERRILEIENQGTRIQ